MNILLDIGVAVLVALFFYSGFKRGIIYAAINAAGTVVSVIAAALLSSVFASMIYHSFIKDSIVSGASSATDGITLSDPALAAEQTLDSVSNFTRNTLSYLGVDKESLTKEYEKTQIDIPNTIEELVRPGALQVVACVVMIVLFLIFMVLTVFLANRFTKNINRTVLGIPNKIAGAALGVIEAAVIIMVIDMILFFIMVFISPSAYDGLTESIDKTVFYKPIITLNIPGKIISGITSL